MQIDNSGLGNLNKLENVSLSLDKMKNIKFLLYDLIRECIGKRSFEGIRYLIGDEKVDNLNNYFQNFIEKRLSEFQKKIGCLIFFNEIEDFSIKILINENNTFGIENSKGL
jgi:hypothetical protein